MFVASERLFSKTNEILSIYQIHCGIGRFLVSQQALAYQKLPILDQ